LKEKLRVAVVAPGRWHAFDLARELQARGALDRLVTNYPRWKTRQWGIPDERVRSFFWHYLITRAIWECGGERLDIALSRFFCPWFGRAARHACRDARHLHVWAGAGLEIMRQGSRRPRPTILLDRASAHRTEQDRILAAEFKEQGKTWPARPNSMTRRELKEYRLSDGVVVPSLFVQRTFLRQGFPEKRIHLAGLGVNLQAFRASPRPPGEVRILYAGSLSIRKGIPRLLKAFRQANLPGVKLVLVGGMAREIRPFLQNLPPTIELMGHVPQSQLAKIYRRASFFVMPSVEEGQAMVQLQALAGGLPLVCTDHTGGEDLLAASGPSQDQGSGICEYPAGFLVPAADEEGLAEAMRRMVLRPGLLEAKRKNVVAMDFDSFSWGRYAERVLAIHEKTLVDLSH